MQTGPRSDIAYWAAARGVSQSAEEATAPPDTDSESMATTEKEPESDFELTFAAETELNETTECEGAPAFHGEESTTPKMEVKEE